jgi:hypothetical protein
LPSNEVVAAAKMKQIADKKAISQKPSEKIALLLKKRIFF